MSLPGPARVSLTWKRSPRNELARTVRVSIFVVVLFASAAVSYGQADLATLSNDVHDFLAHENQNTIRVIVSGDSETVRDAARLGGREHRVLADGTVLELSRQQLRRLAREAKVHISGDLPVAATMLVTNPAVAADQVWAGWGGGLLGLASYKGVNGQGIGVALIDSGVMPTHNALRYQLAASIDLATNAAGTNDEFGHGTHVAGIIAGRTTSTTTFYSTGVAPGAKLVNVRVLGAEGSGLTSDVIAGIDWAVNNRNSYNIRVINLSLGHPVTESWTTDPMCRAISRAVSAGVVVVASAGNSGRTADGHTVLGGISSPGNCPYAITAGAISTHGTSNRSDDTVASYSSRGPTQFDFGVKPDVVAPGTRLVAPEAANSWISAHYPVFHTGGSGTNAYMALTGTSMSAAVVSGGVALLLQASPSLTPAQVKLALQTSATFMPDGGLIAAGAGSINLRGARQEASDGLIAGLVTKILGTLVPSSGAAYWDGGTLIDRVYNGTGIRLLGLLELPLVWLNTSLLKWGDLNLLGLTNPIRNIAPNYIVWGDVARWSNSYYIVWGDHVNDPQGEYIVWGDTNWDYIVWGDSLAGSEEP